MVKLIRFFTAAVVLAVSFNATKAQIKSFGRDPEVFMKELEKHMTGDKIESAILTYQQFKAKWDAKSISEENIQRIIKTCNELLKKKMKVSPEFESFLKLIIGFVDKGKLDSHYPAWDKIVQTRYNQTSRRLFDFIDGSKNLLEAGILNITQTRKWYALSPDFEFIMDNNRPCVVFKNTDLKCVSAKDSGFIYGTAGKFYMDDYTWTGTGGTVTWERSGVAPRGCNAEFSKYDINMERGEYKADSVLFQNVDYLSQKIYGSLEDKVLDFVRDSANATYPRFKSYRKDLIITKFVDNVRYVGGFAQQGPKILASGDEKTPAVFKFFYKNRLVLQVEGEELFVLKNERVVTDKAAITIFMDSGTTLTHPQVNFNYIVAQQLITITRGDEGIYRAPFVDNFHNMDIYADIIQWKVDQPKFDIKMILKDASAAGFESGNYFKDYKYEKVQGILDYNPLQKIKQYCDEKRTKKFNLKDYSRFANATVENLIAQFIQLHDGGFLSFNVKTNDVVVYEKTFNYVNSHFGRTDYDIISFQSIIGGLPNASINLENFDMQVEGVPTIKFSDSQNVYVVPTEQHFIVKKNRDIQFAGKVSAGRFEFFGNGFYFDYLRFNVKMTNVDSMRFFFPDDNGNLVKVNSVMQDVSGTLYIDQQYNKSGLKDYPEYPIFKSSKGSKVFYDQAITWGGVYTRDHFWFEVDPFTIDSLDNFTRSGIQFPGNFKSADIFPDIRETLVLMDDYSLGFNAPHTLPMYKSTGTGAFTSVSLSNRGLYGTGEIDFAGSVTKSDKFMLFPDSTNGFSKSFTLGETSLYPGAIGKDVYTHWEPYKDRMSQFTIKDPIKMYGTADFFGEFIHGKKGSKGNGGLNFEDATLSSNNMKFLPKKLTADSSTLVIKSIDTAKFAFRAANVKADVDMEKRMGDFKANGEGANSEFPYNMFKCSLNEFKWDMKGKSLRFLTPPSVPDEKSYFISTNVAQDSLSFISKDATYSLTDYVIRANKVPYVDVADSRIFPDSNKMVIRENGAIDMLKKAKVTIDVARKYHTLYDCNINITSKYIYSGNGKYDYIDRGKHKNTVLISSIVVDKFTRTAIATGTIGVGDDFTVCPRIKYRGAITITGVNRGPVFDGLFLPVTDLDQPLTWWFRHKQMVPPDSVYLRVIEPLNDDKKDLYTGFAVANDTSLMYSNIFSRKRNYSDSMLLNVKNGVFYYDDAKQEFIYGDSMKLTANALKGQLFTYNLKAGEMYGEGHLDFDVNSGAFNVEAAGNVEHKIADTSFTVKSSMLIDFPFPDDVLKLMSKNLNENSVGNAANNDAAPHVKKALSELLNEKDFKRVNENIDKTGSIEVVNALEKTLFISDVEFKWNARTRSFKTTNGLSLSNALKERTGKQLPGAKIEIQKKRSGDEITIYLETDAGHYYYFNYYRNRMSVLSSDEAFMALLKEKMEKFSKDGYILGLATELSKQKFLRNFEN